MTRPLLAICMFFAGCASQGTGNPNQANVQTTPPKAATAPAVAQESPLQKWDASVDAALEPFSTFMDRTFTGGCLLELDSPVFGQIKFISTQNRTVTSRTAK